MARYTGPVCRLCRREGMKLFLKGERCYTEKCAIEKRNMPPGQHGKLRKAGHTVAVFERDPDHRRRTGYMLHMNAFGGATVRLPRDAGWGNAMRWLLTGEEYGAAEAYRKALPLIEKTGDLHLKLLAEQMVADSQGEAEEIKKMLE